MLQQPLVRVFRQPEISLESGRQDGREAEQAKMSETLERCTWEGRGEAGDLEETRIESPGEVQGGQSKGGSGLREPSGKSAQRSKTGRKDLRKSSVLPALGVCSAEELPGIPRPCAGSPGLKSYTFLVSEKRELRQ